MISLLARSALVAAGLRLLSPLPSPAGDASPWWWEPIAPQSEVRDPVLELDALERPWVVGLPESGPGIALVRRFGDAWVFEPGPPLEQMPSPLRWSPDLTVDRRGNVSIAWPDTATGEVSVGTLTRASWNVMTVQGAFAWSTIRGRHRVHATPTGELLLFYAYDTWPDADLFFAQQLGADWLWEVASSVFFPRTDPGFGEFAPDGTPLLRHCFPMTHSPDITRCHVRIRAETGWRDLEVRGVTSQTSLTDVTLDAGGKLHVVGVADPDINDPEAPYGPSYWKEDAGPPEHEFLPTGQALAIGVDGQGTPRVLAVALGGGYETLVRTRSGWQAEPVAIPKTFSLVPEIYEIDDEGDIRTLATDGTDLYYVSTAIELVAPTRGIWLSASVVPLRWRGEGPVDVELSSDDGATWTILAAGVQTNAYAFAVPDSPGRIILRLTRNSPPSTAEIRGHVVDTEVLAEESGESIAISADPDGPSGVGIGVSLRSWPSPYRGGDLTIRFSVSNAAAGRSRVAISVHDVNGRLVHEVVRGFFSQGTHDAHWNGRDANGRGLVPGIYFLSADVGGRRTSAKLTVLR